MRKVAHLRISLLAIFILHLLIGCDVIFPDYSLADLGGIWTGEAENSSGSFSLDLMVDTEGVVTGSGVRSIWDIDEWGEVTGGGTFSFFTNGLEHYITTNASWSMDLSYDKTELSGEITTSFAEFYDMNVDLTKTDPSFLTVEITDPSDNSTVSGTVEITVTIHSSNVTSKVEFYIDESLKYTDKSSPYSYTWNTTQYSDGSYTIKVIAYNTGNQVESDQLTVTVNNPKWKFSTGGDVGSSPAIGSDGTIYVGSRDSNLYAINPDGTKKWQFLTGDYVNSSPAIGSDGTIYIGSCDDKLHAVNPDGTKKWEFLTGDYVNSSPAIGSDGTIYVGSRYPDNKLYAINPDGTKKWDFLTGASVNSSPAIGSDGTIYIGSNDKNLYAVNPNGTKKWEFLAGGNGYSSPAVGSDGTIYVGSDDNNLYAIYGSGHLADTPWPMYRHDLQHTGKK